MPESEVHERRRYSSVLFRHPSLKSLSDVRRGLGKETGRGVAVGIVTGIEQAQLERVPFYYGRSLYPPRLQASMPASPGGRYPHDLYIGILPDLQTTGPPAVLIASPYIRLLARAFTTLRQALPNPTITYLSVGMRQVYDAFSRGEVPMRASKLTLEMLNEPTSLELVSLSGRNPLRSDLYSAIARVAAPYAIRAEVTSGRSVMKVNFDRHGNFWWYLTREEQLSCALSMVFTLDRIAALREVKTRPIDRAKENSE